MTTQEEKARALRALHAKGAPLMLFNAWDAGSAKELTKIGSAAIATSSWAVAAAQGYEDGQALPFARALATVDSIVRVTDLPVTIDVEAGYGRDPATVAQTVKAVTDTGAVGINLEDRIIGGEGLFSVEEQCRRLNAARTATALPIFINARTDVFFGSDAEPHGERHLAEALSRAAAYAEAGADGLFVPGLLNEELLEALCIRSPLPINVMIGGPGSPAPKRLAELGVSRISYGPFSYLAAMDAFRAAAVNALQGG